MIDTQECETCKTVRLADENVPAWNLYCEMHPLLYDGLGGINTGLIRWHIEMMGITTAWRIRELLGKIGAIVAAQREAKP